MTTAIRTWVRQVLSLAETGLEGVDLPHLGGPAVAQFADRFRDELGHRRPWDRAFLAATLRAEPSASAQTVATDTVAGWDAVAAGGRGAEIAPSAPMFPDRRADGVELWTEQELSGLHAQWWLEWRRDPEETIERLLPIARWHADELQPDNATQRPWAAHVFRLVGESAGDAEIRLHADTLIHASIIRTGCPDVVSALILRDAARAAEAWLDRADASG